jgi:uncharacterized protein YegP (UPF0339 family)
MKLLENDLISKNSTLLSNSEKRFNTVEYKTNNSNSRHHFTSPEDMQSFWNEPGTFTSAYVHTEKIKEHYKTYHNLKGYEGEVYSDHLTIQTDNAHWLASLGDLRRLIEHLETDFGIKREWLQYNYDGEGNFIIRIPERLFGGFEPDLRLPAVHALLARRLSGSASLNWNVYKHSALLPMVNTAVVKSRMYAVPLTSGEIFLDHISIEELAGNRRTRPAAANQTLPVIPLLEELKEEVARKATLSYEFFSALFNSPIKGFINIRHLENKKSRKKDKEYSNVFTSTICEAILQSELYNGKENVYFGIAERESFGDGSKENCSKLNAIYADVDYGSDGHKEPAYFSTKAEALEMINSLKLKPTIVIHSGHGFQIFWKLQNSLGLKDKEVQMKSETLMHHLNEMLHGDPTQNVDRIFRVPFTLNIKGALPAMCTIDRMSPECVYSFEELEGWVSAEYKPMPKPAPRTSKLYSGMIQNNSKLLSKDVWEYLKSRCDWVKRIYQKAEGEHHLRHNERFNISSLLVKFEQGENEIHNIMRQCSDYDEGQTGYQIMQIKSADYKPPLCSKLCSANCYVIEDVAGRSPITLAYRRDDNE